MNHTPLNVTPEQRANLTKLADGLEANADRAAFDMESYSLDFDRPDQVPPKCGTVACAAGHGPMLGIPARAGESWCQYVGRVFCGEELRDWNWMFSDHWESTDNTAKGAAARIRYALEKGIPKNALSQMLGKQPLSYEVPE